MLKTTSGGIFDTTKSRAEAFADQIKVALNDLCETLALQLPFCFEVSSLSDRLMSSTPE
jgi:hypothetical protein